MSRIRPFVVLASAAALGACASHAPAPATGTGQAAIPPTAHGAQGKQIAFNLKGYHRVLVKGQEYFCRYEVVTDSLIKQEVCLTRSQLAAQQQAAQSELQNIRQYSASCSTSLTPGGGANCQP